MKSKVLAALISVDFTLSCLCKAGRLGDNTSCFLSPGQLLTAGRALFRGHLKASCPRVGAVSSPRSAGCMAPGLMILGVTFQFKAEPRPDYL